MTQSPLKVSIELLPAHQGDAILIRCYQESQTINIMIDGGPSSAYDDHLRPRLQQLSAGGEEIALWIITHIDDDHIGAAIRFFQDNGPCNAPQIIQVREIWHNSYRHLRLRGIPSTSEDRKRIAAQAQIANSAIADAVGEKHISATQGSTLAELLIRNQYPWNSKFDGGAVVAGQVQNIEISPNIRAAILSPTDNELNRLRKFWRRKLIEFGISPNVVDNSDFERHFEAELHRLSQKEDEPIRDKNISATTTIPAPDEESFSEDTSLTNASSIAIMLSLGQQRLLLLGDAKPSVVTNGLLALTEGTTTFDAVKVSHHGSKKNTSPDLLRTIRSKAYLFSTNGGRHHHPDTETLLRIARHGRTTMIFNYPVESAKVLTASQDPTAPSFDIQLGDGHTSMILQIPKE